MARVRTSVLVLAAGLYGWGLIGCSQSVTGPNRPPVAEAGPDREVPSGQTARLDGSGSYDPDGDELSYTWELVHVPPGGSAPLQGVDVAQATLRPDAPGVWTVRLIVRDGHLDSVPDVVQVRLAGCSSDAECDDSVACTVDSCSAGTCVNTPDAGLCDDGLWCTGAETCDPAHGCVAGAGPCDDGVACTEDSCDEAGQTCSHSPDDAACDDSQYCDGAETCDPVGGCEPGDDVMCDDGVGCTLDACDEAADRCTAIAQDDRCDDGLACNGAETCDALLDCQPGQALDCDDGFVCTTDSCDELVGCVNQPDDGLCDDGLWCNGAETCDPAAGCQPGTVMSCDDGVACTQDVCDESNDTCEHNSDDGVCNDGNPCTLDTCDPVAGCQIVPGNDGAACSVGACNGTCSAGLCPPCSCSNDSECDDGFACTTDTCSNGVCSHAVDDGLCDDGAWCNGAETCEVDLGCQTGVAPDCSDAVGCSDDSCDEVNDICVHAVDDANCDDGAWCNGAETCDAVLDCQPGNPPDCDDGVACTVDGCDEGQDACDHAPDDAACDNGAFCDGAETCDAVLGCRPGNPPVCDDGIECTVDGCDEGADACTAAPDASWCQDNGIGGICRPACFSGPTGCGQPPDDLNLSCAPDPVDLSQGAATTCRLDLGLAGQDGCLACQAEVGFVQVDRTGFDGCDPNGWTLESGTFCYDGYANCVAGNQNQDCCADFNSICLTANGDSYLQTDKADNCGGGAEEWHLEKVFDFTDLTDLRVCFDRADHNANNNQAIALSAEDLDAPGAQQVACWAGEPRGNIDDVFLRTCADLPGWVAGRPHVKLQFLAHSENNDRTLMLDNISVTGWTSGCAQTVIDLLTEDFDGCADPLPATFGDWMVTGTLPCHPSDFTCYDDSDRLVADETSGSLETWVDASSLDAGVELCLYYGDKAGDQDKTLLVEFDTGMGWQTAFSHTGNQGPDNTCFELCVDLSAADPAVNRNPDLGLRISLSSGKDPVAVDHVVLRGVHNCAGAAELGFGVRTDQGDGTYTFDVTDLNGVQLDGDIQCSWDNPPPGQEVAGSDVVAWRDQVPNWGYRRKLAFDNSGQATDLPGFPVLVVLDAAWFDYNKVLQPGGGDLLFVDEDLFTVLPHEIEQWDPAGVSYIWVRVPRIDAATDLDHIWMYYGDPINVFAQDPAGVWQDYDAVWHLAEDVVDEQDTGVHHDSTGNGNDGLQRGNVDYSPCVIGTCQAFDGLNDHVEVPSTGLQITGQALTVEALAYHSGGVLHQYRHVLGAGSDGHFWQLWFDSLWDGWHGRLLAANGDGSIYTNDGGSNQWSYLALQYDGAEVRLYLNAAQIGAEATSGNLVALDTPIWLGDNPGLWPRMFPGRIDEVRISERVLSQDWLAAQYLSMFDAFITFGPEEPL